MPKFQDLTGQRFGYLTVIRRAENAKNHCTRFLCRCDCGKEIITLASSLKKGLTKSCGCLRKKLSAETRTKHGLRYTRLYRIWQGVKSRCSNSRNADYKFYGGRGISIYPEWESNFSAFYEYVSQLEHCGEDGYTLDRIDVDGNYEPGNLRFADNRTQKRNTHRNVWVDYYGVQMLLVDVAKITGIKYDTLRRRIKLGWTGDDLFIPTRKVMPKSDLLLIENSQVYATSLIIAEKFGRRHDNILQAIENELANLREISAENPTALNFKDSKIENSFIKGEYKDASGKSNPMYYLNRDAFAFVVMGFTGKDAALWKWRYIQEFNRMESALTAINQS